MKVNANFANKRIEWFDTNCRLAKKRYKKSLKRYKKEGSNANRLQYMTDRKDYRVTCKNAKQNYLHLTQTQICNAKDSKTFWKIINQYRKKTNSALPIAISNAQWVEHFRTLFNSSQDIIGTNIVVNERPDVAALTKLFEFEEISHEIKLLKTGKSPGNDDILNEFLLAAPPNMIEHLTKFFNIILDQESIPYEWRDAIVVPIHKKGAVELPGNYRGISLLSSVYKLFTGIIQKRLNKWLIDNRLLPEEQAGFHSGYSTTDHIFVLDSLIQKQLAVKRGKLYVFFVDFSKAFDMVNRDKLYESLGKIGAGKKFINLIKILFHKSSAKVRTSKGFSESFEIK